MSHGGPRRDAADDLRVRDFDDDDEDNDDNYYRGGGGAQPASSFHRQAHTNSSPKGYALNNNGFSSSGKAHAVDHHDVASDYNGLVINSSFTNSSFLRKVDAVPTPPPMHPPHSSGGARGGRGERGFADVDDVHMEDMDA